MSKSKLVNFDFFINPDKASVEQDEKTETMNVGQYVLDTSRQRAVRLN